MNFWSSDLGQLTGNPEDAFTQSFSVIPDGTKAIAKIVRMYNVEHNGEKRIEIDWELVDGEFKGRHVFHKLKVFDENSNKRHKALNMLMLIYKMFKVQPSSTEPPSDDFMKVFIGKHAGIKVQEWENDGKCGNWVSEVHPSQSFKCETGVKMVVTSTPSAVESAFSRNPKVQTDVVEDDIPW